MQSAGAVPNQCAVCRRGIGPMCSLQVRYRTNLAVQSACNPPPIYIRGVYQWAYCHGIELKLIQPGKPMQNGYVESFHGKFRDLAHARETISNWRLDYNEQRPHSPLWYQAPLEFVSALRPGKTDSKVTRRFSRPTTVRSSPVRSWIAGPMSETSKSTSHGPENLLTMQWWNLSMDDSDRSA